MNIYCYYHDDMDGRCAAAIVRRAVAPEPIFIPVQNVGLSNPDFSSIQQRDIVIVVDISMSLQSIMNLRRTAGNVVWIDHHKTTGEVLGDIILKNGPNEKGFSTYYMSGMGGACKLTWDYYFRKAIPTCVQMISDYDEWKYEYGDETMLFHLGIELENMEPASGLWDGIFNSKRTFADYYISKGEPILSYQERRVKDLLENYSFNTMLDGITFLAINTDTHNIALRKKDLTSFAPNVDGLLLFSMQNRKWVVSMYTHKEDVDVSSIAKRRGGGGHRAAAGFSTDDISLII